MFAAEVTGRKVQKGMGSLVEAIQQLSCALCLFGLGLVSLLEKLKPLLTHKPPMHCGNVDRVMGLASVQKLESIKVRKQSRQDVAAEMEENNSFVNGLDWMCAFAWALMKLTELIRKQGKAAWGFGGLSLDKAILVQELVMFLLSVYACSVLRQSARLPEYT